MAGTAAATAGGVAVGQFGKMTSSKEIAKYAADLLVHIYDNVYGFLIEKDNMEEAVELKETTDRLCNKILDELDWKQKQEKRNQKKKANRARAKIPAKEQEEALEYIKSAEESVASLANSFQELGILHMISFSKVIVENEFRDKVLKLIENDNLLFTIKNALGCDHYFCKKGVVKTNVGWSRETVYYNYSNLSNLEKNWAGVLRDKPSGYKIDMNIMENWQTPIIDFIKSKQS